MCPLPQTGSAQRAQLLLQQRLFIFLHSGSRREVWSVFSFSGVASRLLCLTLQQNLPSSLRFHAFLWETCIISFLMTLTSLLAMTLHSLIWSLVDSHALQSWHDRGTLVLCGPAVMQDAISSLPSSFSYSLPPTFLGKIPLWTLEFSPLTTTTSPSITFRLLSHQTSGSFPKAILKLSVMSLDTRHKRNGISPLILKRERLAIFMKSGKRDYLLVGVGMGWWEKRLELHFIYQMTSQ